MEPEASSSNNRYSFSPLLLLMVDSRRHALATVLGSCAMSDNTLVRVFFPDPGEAVYDSFSSSFFLSLDQARKEGFFFFPSLTPE